MRNVKMHKVGKGGQISLPARIRNRWGTNIVALEDRGDSVVIRPLPDDPVTAARGMLRGRVGASEEIRAAARKDEADAEARR